MIGPLEDRHSGPKGSSSPDARGRADARSRGAVVVNDRPNSRAEGASVIPQLPWLRRVCDVLTSSMFVKTLHNAVLPVSFTSS